MSYFSPMLSIGVYSVSDSPKIIASSASNLHELQLHLQHRSEQLLLKH
ncbi:MAG: hypothetical protein AB1604_10750 [Euryarchaeota archaeon]